MTLHTNMDLFDALVRSEALLWGAVDDALRGSAPIRLGTLQALRVIRGSGGGARVNELAAGLGITVGASSKLVDRLERDGFVRREAHATDGRSSVISLSAEGERAEAEGTRVASAVLQRITVGVDADILREELGALSEAVASDGKDDA